jgi:hypothetical protein
VVLSVLKAVLIVAVLVTLLVTVPAGVMVRRVL